MLGTFRKSIESLPDVERLAGKTRERFGLDVDDVVLVTEVECSLPGCPPRETVIAFWQNGLRHHFKVFKPLSDVGEDDLPLSWLKDSLALPEGIACECC